MIKDDDEMIRDDMNTDTHEHITHMENPVGAEVECTCGCVCMYMYICVYYLNRARIVASATCDVVVDDVSVSPILIFLSKSLSCK